MEANNFFLMFTLLQHFYPLKTSGQLFVVFHLKWLPSIFNYHVSAEWDLYTVRNLHLIERWLHFTWDFMLDLHIYFSQTSDWSELVSPISPVLKVNE